MEKLYCVKFENDAEMRLMAPDALAAKEIALQSIEGVTGRPREQNTRVCMVCEVFDDLLEMRGKQNE